MDYILKFGELVVRRSTAPREAGDHTAAMPQIARAVVVVAVPWIADPEVVRCPMK